MPLLKPTNDDEKKEIKRLIGVIDIFRTLRQTMPLQYVMTLLMVAYDEGRSVIEYAHKAGVPPSVMSRHLLDIGARNRHFEEGFGLVDFRPDPMNLRKHNYYLTDKGRAVVQQVLRQNRER
jgi:DNA-binding MarR family transcriptional regulator